MLNFLSILEYNIGFQWVLRPRCLDINSILVIAKTANRVEDDFPERCLPYYRENSNPRLDQ